MMKSTVRQRRESLVLYVTVIFFTLINLLLANPLSVHKNCSFRENSPRANEMQKDEAVELQQARAVAESRRDDKEAVGVIGNIEITAGNRESIGVCKPGDEDCG